MTAQRYRPLYKLDAGGMAEVYVAEAESMAGFKKKVAIKRILPGLIKDQRFVRMFLDEARLSLRLNHANVVSVFDIGESENTYFIVMDRRVDFWPAMALSMKIVNERFGTMFLYLLMTILINFVGALCCYVGLFVTLPLTLLMLAYIYEDIFGQSRGTA